MTHYRQNIVILTGAGISSESGLSTYRDESGLWTEYDADIIATPQGFESETEICLEFYNKLRLNVYNAQPNVAHITLANLEIHHDVTIITQNIDDLHERAGSTNVLHLHGELTKVTSSKRRLDENCIQIWSLDKPIKVGDLASDGAQLRPHIVMFGEYLTAMVQAIKIVKDADIFVIIGTSLKVFPANTLINHVHPECPRFSIDPADVPVPDGYIHFKLTATEGVLQLIEYFKHNLKIL